MKQIIAVIITDTHLKESNLEINKSVYNQVATFCLNNGVETFFHLGDIFNSRKAQTQEVLVDGFGEILSGLDRTGLKMIAIPGNHDRTDYASYKSFLDPFKHHPSFTLIDTYYKFEIMDGIMCHMIPFFSDEVYNSILSTVQYESGYKHILFTHIGITGARMNNGKEVVSISQAFFKNYSAVYCGHYHDQQIFDKFNYIGASIQHNFGETPDKGITVLYNDLTFMTIPLEYPRYHKLEVDVNLLTPQYVNEIEAEAKKSGDNLRVVLVGPEQDVKSFNKQVLQNAGISVQTKEDVLVKSEIEGRVIPFNAASLQQAFTDFCDKNSLNIATGQVYLDKITITSSTNV